MIQFKNLKDLLAKLSDEDICRKHLEEMRWGDKPQCPFCNAFKPYKLKDGKKYRCKEKTCRRDFTVTTGTVMENTKISHSVWIVASYVLSSHKKASHPASLQETWE